MSFVTGFVVYGILFWFFIAMMVLIATRDHFSRSVSEPPADGARHLKGSIRRSQAQSFRVRRQRL